MNTGIVSIFASIFDAVQGWFVSIFTSAGVGDFFFAVFAVVLSVRFLLMPILGYSNTGSDKAKKTNGRKG